jgi:hypothetical protein
MFNTLLLLTMTACTTDPMDTGNPPTPDESLAERIDGEAMDRRLRDLSELASVHGDRLTTSEGEKKPPGTGLGQSLRPLVGRSRSRR